MVSLVLSTLLLTLAYADPACQGHECPLTVNTLLQAHTTNHDIARDAGEIDGKHGAQIQECEYDCMGEYQVWIDGVKYGGGAGYPEGTVLCFDTSESECFPSETGSATDANGASTDLDSVDCYPNNDSKSPWGYTYVKCTQSSWNTYFKNEDGYKQLNEDGSRCDGDPSDGWANFGKDLSQDECTAECTNDGSCTFVVFNKANGACTKWSSCASFASNTVGWDFVNFQKQA